MELTVENLESVVSDCLFKKDEDRGNYVEGSGVILRFGFHPERLEKHRADIEDMLNQLPDEFKKNSGGGYSFGMAYRRKDGVHWGEHRHIDTLLCLGIAIGKARTQFPRDMWNIFPGGLPYFVIN